MANVEIVVEARGPAKVVAVRGSIDTSTTEEVDLALSDLAAGERPMIVLDFSGLDYLNSRGIANLVKHHDATAEAGGGIVLASVPEKIMSTLEVMGLADTLRYAPDVDAAVEALSNMPEPERAAFPMTFNCDACYAPLTADRPGKYRCPRCQGAFAVLPEGRVQHYPARDARSVESMFPCSPVYVENARSAAGAVARDVELSSIATELLDRTVDEAMGLFVGKCSDGRSRLRMYVSADARHYDVAFFVADEALLITDEDQEDLTFRTLRGIVDDLEIVALEPEGQMLRMSKSIEM